MKFFILIFIIFFSTSLSHLLVAQDKTELDSLYNLLEEQKKLDAQSDSTYLLLRKVAEKYKRPKPDSAIIIYQEALQILEFNNDSTQQALVLADIGRAYQQKGETYVALDYLKKSYLMVRILENKDPHHMAWTSIDIGNIYFQEGLYNFAVDFYQQAKHIFLEVNDTFGIALSYKNLAGTYNYIDNCDSTYYYAYKDLELSLLGDFKPISSYLRIGLAYSCLKDFENVIATCKKALTFVDNDTTFEDPIILWQVYHNLINTYIKHEQGDSAYAYFERANLVIDRIDNPSLKRRNH